MAKIPVALQLYTVRDQTAIDFAGTVRKVAKLGYAGVEFAGTGGLSGEALNDLLKENNLKPAGTHISLDALRTDADKVIAENKAYGAQYVGIGGLPKELCSSAAGWHKAAEVMNEVGAKLRAAGLTFYYHNHYHEFEVMDGEVGMDILLAETDPAAVAFECDVYWAWYAGVDPVALLNAFAGRFPLIHLKDMSGKGDNRTFVEIGEGHIAFQPIFEAAEAQGAKWYIVEQDTCARPSLESAAISLRNLKLWRKA
ncbi:MAG: sugar phosphate isomerase/epimerase [Chloroflexi bacterium]|nr:sugar phosphate isomerase/epimerase [Chloroflexota bacterium]